MRLLMEEDHFDWKHGKAGNINLEGWFSPCPVNMFENDGLYDIVGNVWQHCSTPIYPYEGFRIHPNYEDFTTPTFDGRHMLIKGGSFVSCGNSSFRSARFAFRRHFYQFAGFRYVTSDHEPCMPPCSFTVTDQVVQTFLKIHYLDSGSYVRRVEHLLLEHCQDPKARLLIVGCSVGSVVLRMSRNFAQVFGTDNSARFFQMACRILQDGKIAYQGL